MEEYEVFLKKNNKQKRDTAKADIEDVKKMREQYQTLINSLKEKHKQADKLIKECTILKKRLEKVSNHDSQ